jgi:hypothetical protein
MAKIKPSSDLPRGSKSQFYIEGYELDVAEDVTSGHTTEEEIAHVYGRDDPLKATNISGGTLSVQILEKSKNNTLYEVLCGLKPEDDSLKSYDLTEMEDGSCWFNVKHPIDDRYVQARFFGQWAPAPGDRAFPPNAWSRTTFAGPADVEKRYDEAPGVGVRIEAELVTASASGSDYTGSLTKVPVKDQTRGLNLVRLATLTKAANGLVQERDEIIVDINTCGDAQQVIYVDNDELDDTKSGVTHFYAVYLQTGSGTLPSDTSIQMDGIHS